MMNRSDLQARLYLSGMDERAPELARRLGLGLEITTFCEAAAFERPESRASAREQTQGIPRLRFHAPFAELAPCAIDALVRDVAFRRFRQSLDAAARLGASLVVIHDGFIPLVYFPEWFVPQSVNFWRSFLAEGIPDGICIALENVMDPDPAMMVEIVRQVGDPRLGLCLDVGHANTCVSRLAPQAWIEPMAEHLLHVHLHNNCGDRDLHAPLGDGTIPMDAVLDALLRTCPQASYTLENQDCTASLAWLSQHGYLREEISK